MGRRPVSGVVDPRPLCSISPWRRFSGDDAALGALPAVLDPMVAAFGLRAALAFQPAGGRPSVLAVHPPGAADQALLARIGVMAVAQR